jgi:pyridoxamine 5'-phosphate oxidase
MNAFTAQRLPEPLPAEPLKLAKRWLEQATAERVQPNPNSMVLSTVGAGGPSSRVVLCKDIVAPPGYLVVYTNYQSRKGVELASEPRFAALFHWDQLHRQVRVEGRAVKSPAAESDAYFASRAWQSRVGAWASAQSRPVGSREQLIEALRAAGRRFGTPPLGPDAPPGEDRQTVDVPRPPHWGGYRLWADTVELWVEGEYRIHDRARWTRPLTPAGDGGEFTFPPWQAERLQP